MRLIDADAFIKRFHNGNSDTKAQKLMNSTVRRMIREQPTAYDSDKVVEQLENERKFWENAYDSNLGKEKARSYEHAIEIVKGGGVDG